mmetsp:Transcript_41880/g.66527  ORF Transcript_41880/g.66527 Transcript_41880/m.66527 type:complete len:658 (+) Transcript_41880:72-2045(+)
MSVCFAVLCFVQVGAATFQRLTQERTASHDLTWDDRGRLVFTQVQSETRRSKATAKVGLTELYSVNVNLDIESMESKNGVTMMFDKTAHVMRLDTGISPVDGIAWGSYDDTITTNGWSSLWVDTTGNTDVSNDVRMYAAGYIEGIITCVRLSEYYYNFHKLVLRSELTKHAMQNLKALFTNQLGFMKMKAKLVPHIMAEEPDEPYWKHARYSLFQLWGITDGYNYAANHFGTTKLALEDILILNMGGELPTMMEAYTPKAAQDRAAAVAMEQLSFLQRGSLRGNRNSKQATLDMAPINASELDDAHWERRVAETGHCSALIRVTQDNQDLFMGHTTWDDYSKMTRIFKYYNFPFDGAATMATKIGFSSYPGTISSTDNFYAMSSGLAVMDTSIEVLTPFIWDKVQEFGVKPYIPNFIHLMAVNRMAKNGAHWTRLMATQNTGTYCSQWMVVDYNRFAANKPVPDDTLWILEAVPGLTHAADTSNVLREQGYWPSFNRPYFDDVRQATGHTNAQRQLGSIYSWLNNPRAKIFRGGIKSLNGLMEMRQKMTRNLFPFTGVLPAEPGHEISARMDLSISMPIPNGGIDAKVINRCTFKALQVQAISSPAHDAVPAFQWTNDDGTERWPGYPHNGLPNKWNFGWVQMTPLGQAALTDIVDC